MILRFLRMFSVFRALEAERDHTVVLLREELQQLSTEKLLLQDRLDAVLQDRSNLWDMTRECINNERASYQSHINLQWGRQGLPAPWPDAPSMPEGLRPQTHQEPIPRRELPSEAVARARASNLRSIVTSLG